MAESASARLRWAVERADTRPGERILEIGCGPGVAADLVCRRLQHGRYVGIDRSATAIAAAGRRCAAFARAGLATFHNIDVAAASLPDALFDLIFGIRVAAIAEGRPAALAAVGGWLAPGGRLLVIHDKPGMDGTEVGLSIVRRLEPLGWAAVSTHVAPPADGGMTAVRFERR